LRCYGIARLREGHHSILPPFLQGDDQLEPSGEVAAAPVGWREEQQSVAVFTGQHVGLDLEAVDRERLGVALLRGEHLLDQRELLAYARVLLLQRTHLLR
jgi:hypothetical protein